MAGDVKRYSVGNIDPVVMCEEADGDYVEYSDHAARLTALEQEKLYLEQQNKRLREALEKLVLLYEAEFDPEVANLRPDWLRAALAQQQQSCLNNEDKT